MEKSHVHGRARGAAMMVVGLFITSIGIALSAKAGLGTTPQATLPYVLSLNLPLSLGMWTLAVNLVIVFAEWLLMDRRMTAMLALQIPVMLLFSAFNDLAMWIVSPIPAPSYAGSWAMLLASVAVLSFGTALSVKADFSYGPCDGIVRVVAMRRRTEFGSVKLPFDVFMVVLAVVASLVLSGGLNGVREGTLVAMLLIGPVVRVMTRALRAEPVAAGPEGVSEPARRRPGPVRRVPDPPRGTLPDPTRILRNAFLEVTHGTHDWGPDDRESG